MNDIVTFLNLSFCKPQTNIMSKYIVPDFYSSFFSFSFETGFHVVKVGLKLPFIVRTGL